MAASGTGHLPGMVSLIAFGKDEAVPSGVPYGAVTLDSLDTPEVRAWVDEHAQYAIFIVVGKEFESGGVPALSVRVTADEYNAVAAHMPR